jgi:hypothetical protein
MIRVKRLDEPSILAEKKAEWQARYEAKAVASPGARPESKQYAHPQIVDTLHAMSHGKCFYCEAPGKMTVDHYIEVAERRDLAFHWENLYLACDGCQAKLPNTSIPAAACVDPCDGATDPAEHLAFDAELISWRTPEGEQTIKKYRLKRLRLESERRRRLQEFNTELLEILKTKAMRELSAVELLRLRRYGRADAPFSLMLSAYLEKYDLARDT